MRSLIRQAAAGFVLAASLALPAGAQTAPAAPPEVAKGPPAGFVAPAEPLPTRAMPSGARASPATTRRCGARCANRHPARLLATLPGAEQGVLIQSFVQYPGSRLTTAGEAWRQVRNNWIIPYGGALLLIAVLALALVYWRKGPFGSPVRDTGRVIERFTPFERATHWAAAISFAVLGISGIVMAFGKFFLLPVLGGTLFGWLTYALKTAHNFAGPLFAVALVIFIITYLRDNLPRAGDLNWLLKGGGMFGGEHVAVAPLQRRREDHVLGRWHRARPDRRGVGLVLDGWCRARRNAGADAGGPHRPCRGFGADDGAVHRPHLHGDLGRAGRDGRP
jgi:formate dehydrogenase subunit gamma